MSVVRPSHAVAVTDADRLPTNDFRRWQLALTDAVNAASTSESVDASIAAIATALGSPDGTVANIPPLSEADIRLIQGYGIAITGDADSGYAIAIRPLGDSGTGALKGITRDAYGRVSGTTDATITGTPGQIAVANGDAVAGPPTLSLADVADAGGGTLQKTAFDAKGRKTGSSAATTDDLTEGAANLYHTDARARAAVIAPTITNGDTTHAPSGDAVFDALAALIPSGYIDGLRMVWVSATAITVTSGAAYIETGGVLKVPTDIAKAGLSLAASTWYHVYLFNNAGTPDVEIVTTAPAAPYNGVARSKTGVNSRRYLGSVVTRSDGSITAFRHSGDSIAYLASTSASPFRVLSNGTVATTETTVSAAGAVPPTSTQADVRVVNQRNDTATFGTPDDDLVLSQASFLLRVPANSEAYPSLQLSASQEFTYYLAGTTGGLYVDVRGYRFER